MMGSFLETSLEIGFMLLVASVVMAFFRLLKGPTLQDRVVALDFMTVAIVAFCGLASILYNTPAFLDVALVLALVGFLATVALARFAERNSARQQQETSDD